MLLGGAKEVAHPACHVRIGRQFSCQLFEHISTAHAVALPSRTLSPQPRAEPAWGHVRSGLPGARLRVPSSGITILEILDSRLLTGNSCVPRSSWCVPFVKMPPEKAVSLSHHHCGMRMGGSRQQD